MSYVVTFGGGLLILLVGYVPAAALGSSTGRLIRRVCARKA